MAPIALAVALLGGVLTGGMAVAQNSNNASATEPRPFHATGDVRSVDTNAMRLELQAASARRHFRVYAVAPDATVRGPQGPANVSDLAPKMRVRLVGVRAPGDTWTVNQIQILPSRAGEHFPKPFHATGEVRSLDVDAQHLEMQSASAPRHFRVYTLDPDVAVVSPQGPAQLSDITPKMRVRLIGEREADNTWTVSQIEILPKR
jgi:Cu/Ag efflux protein CusF